MHQIFLILGVSHITNPLCQAMCNSISIKAAPETSEHKYCRAIFYVCINMFKKTMPQMITTAGARSVRVHLRGRRTYFQEAARRSPPFSETGKTAIKNGAWKCITSLIHAQRSKHMQSTHCEALISTFVWSKKTQRNATLTAPPV